MPHLFKPSELDEDICEACDRPYEEHSRGSQQEGPIGVIIATHWSYLDRRPKIVALRYVSFADALDALTVSLSNLPPDQKVDKNMFLWRL